MHHVKKCHVKLSLVGQLLFVSDLLIHIDFPLSQFIILLLDYFSKDEYKKEVHIDPILILFKLCILYYLYASLNYLFFTVSGRDNASKLSK